MCDNLKTFGVFLAGFSLIFFIQLIFALGIMFITWDISEFLRHLPSVEILRMNTLVGIGIGTYITGAYLMTKGITK